MPESAQVPDVELRRGELEDPSDILLALDQHQVLELLILLGNNAKLQARSVESLDLARAASSNRFADSSSAAWF